MFFLVDFGSATGPESVQGMPHSNMYNAPSTQNPDLVNGHSAPNHPPMPTQNGPVAPPTGMHNQAFGGRPPQKHPPNPMFQGPLPPGHLAPQSRPGMPPQMNSTTAPLPRPSAGTMTNSQAPLSNPASQATPTINCTPPSHTRGSYISSIHFFKVDFYIYFVSPLHVNC